MPSNFQDSFHRELETGLRGLEAQGWRRPRGSARLRFSMTCRITEDEITRLENCMNTWRDHACRSAAAGTA